MAETSLDCDSCKLFFPLVCLAELISIVEAALYDFGDVGGSLTVPRTLASLVVVLLRRIIAARLLCWCLLLALRLLRRGACGRSPE